MQVSLRKVSECKYEIPKSYDDRMRVPGIVYGNENLIEGIKNDDSLKQVVNVATLPGIVKASNAMPDVHLGYGFPIGGVAGFNFNEGVVSPGAVGYDIGCGVRLIRTDLEEKSVRPKIKELIDIIFGKVPSGVGRSTKTAITGDGFESVLTDGVDFIVEQGYGWKRDIQRIEEYGKILFADRTKVSKKARQRGFSQLGTLGAGNHFLEVQVVDDIFDVQVAKKFGITHKGQVTVMIHTGSRGFGHQVATDYLETIENAMKNYNLTVPDRQLASAPLHSKEAQDYIGAMGSAANFGFSNRQIITHQVREALREVFKEDTESMGADIVYDVAHNMAKPEVHRIDGPKMKVMVHRKGATRAFPSGRSELPSIYTDVGHPVIIPGTMGTASYVLVGTQKSLDETFGSTCHGSGRVMSRTKAIRQYSDQFVKQDLTTKGIYVKASTKYVLQEEAPFAYKNVDEVVRSVECAGLSRLVARLRPIGVMKG